MRCQASCSLFDWLWLGLELPTSRTAAGTKDIDSLPAMPALPACPPWSHQDHSLEPPDNSLLLVGTTVPAGPVFAYGGVWPSWLGRQWDMSRPGKTSSFVLVFFFCWGAGAPVDLDHSRLPRTWNHACHSVCFVRSYLLTREVTSSLGEWKRTQT